MLLAPRRRALRPLLLLSLLALSASAHAQAPVSPAVATANKAELVQLVQESHVNDIWPSKIVSTFNFKLSDAAWKVMLSKEGVNNTARMGRNIGNWFKQQGFGDLEKVETSNNNDRESTQDEVDELIALAKTKMVITVEATQPKLSPARGKLLLQYLSSLSDFPENTNWMPRGGRANLKLALSSTAKDIKVTADKTATNFTIIAPIDEPINWSSKMETALNRYKK